MTITEEKREMTMDEVAHTFGASMEQIGVGYLNGINMLNAIINTLPLSEEIMKDRKKLLAELRMSQAAFMVVTNHIQGIAKELKVVVDNTKKETEASDVEGT